MSLPTLTTIDFFLCYFCGESGALPNNASRIYKPTLGEGSTRNGLTFFSIYYFYYSFRGFLSLFSQPKRPDTLCY